MKDMKFVYFSKLLLRKGQQAIRKILMPGIMKRMDDRQSEMDE